MEMNNIPKLGKINIVFNIFINYNIQNRTYLLKDIFPLENKRKIKKEINNNIIQGMNLIEKKLATNYIKKLSLLLHDSFNYKDYAIKRKNLNKTIYKDIGNNKLRLTFKKFPSKLIKNNNGININKNRSRNIITNDLDEIREKNNSINDIDNDTNNIFKTFVINNDIKEILYNNEEKISLNKEKNIYNKFKNKFLYYKPKLMAQLSSPFFTPIVQANNNKKISYKSTSFNNSLLNKSQQSHTSIYNDINNLFKTCNSLKALRDKKKLDNDILNNKQKLCEEIREIQKEN